MSVRATKCATPLRSCTFGPPRSNAPTSSPMTSFTTAGPVRNMFPRSVITTKSVSAGEYEPPPADAPQITEICGIRPDSATFSLKIRA